MTTHPSRIKADVGERLRKSREMLKLTQAELAELTHISRATQISYESGVTDPTTNYLQELERIGIDIGYILFDEVLGNRISQMRYEDWQLMLEAQEIVNFFCSTHAPDCPSNFRWVLIKFVCEELSKKTDLSLDSRHNAVMTILPVWESYKNSLLKAANKGAA